MRSAPASRALALVAALLLAPRLPAADVGSQGASGTEGAGGGALTAAADGAASSGGDTVEAEAALKTLGAVLFWDPLSRRGAFAKDGHRISFVALDPSVAASAPYAAVFDGDTLIGGPGAIIVSGRLRFSAAFLSAAADAFARAKEDESSRFRVAAIVVDPGHGGKDTGAIGTHVIGGKKVELREKDVVLKVAKELHDRLRAAYPDKRVLMTRTGDSYPTLEDRVAFAHSLPLADNEAVIFVSVHANASFNKSARGFEVWYLSPEYRRTVVDSTRYSDSAEVLPIINAMMEEEFTTESVLIARSVLARIDEAIGAQSPSRGVKAEQWFVVRNARMPSVLIELGFVTNKEDAALLSDPSYLRKLSDAIYTGIADYVSAFEHSGGFTASR